MADSSETTVIAAATQIRGELTFEGQARVVGRIEGKITAKGDLHIAEQGVCDAEISAESVQVDGTVKGNISASELVQLNSRARIEGDIVAQKLVTEEGASIVGHVNVGPGAGKTSQTIGTPPSAESKSREAAEPVSAR